MSLERMVTLDNMCRSFLTPYVDENNKPKYWGRYNQGVVTINLVDVALSSGGDFDKFWRLFEERTELWHKALQCRHERIALATSDTSARVGLGFCCIESSICVAVTTILPLR